MLEATTPQLDNHEADHCALCIPSSLLGPTGTHLGKTIVESLYLVSGVQFLFAVSALTSHPIPFFCCVLVTYQRTLVPSLFVALVLSGDTEPDLLLSYV